MDNTTENQNQNDQNLSEICSICLQNIEQPLAITDSCEHQFHENCISHWLKSSVQCPICKGHVLWLDIFHNEEYKQVTIGELQPQLQRIQSMDNQQLQNINQRIDENQQLNELIGEFETFDVQFLEKDLKQLQIKFDIAVERAEKIKTQDDSLKWFIIDQLQERLKEFEQIPKNLENFDGQIMLQKIYNLDEHIELAKNEKWEKLFAEFKTNYGSYLEYKNQNDKKCIEITDYNEGCANEQQILNQKNYNGKFKNKSKRFTTIPDKKNLPKVRKYDINGDLY